VQYCKPSGFAASTVACYGPSSVIEAQLLRFSNIEDLAILRGLDSSEFSDFVG
jgi:hypothetical protein